MQFWLVQGDYKFRFRQQNQSVTMSKQRSRRINYRINYCSSEDPEGPVSQLVLQSSEARGWTSKRFAPYPQTIVVQLLQLSLVSNMSFLSHQSKICTKIEIEGKEDQAQNWVRLGYTTLQSGANTNYQSRELRNVNLGGRMLLLLKFTFHQNYANHINIFNQIGIIALLVYGEKVTVQRNMIRNKEGNVVANLSDLDRETILKLKNLEQMKNQAIDAHRFDDAKDYKQQIETLQSNIKALIVLQKQKKQAIQRQNYDDAKEIVERMKKLRGPMLFPRQAMHSAHNNYDNKPIDFTPKKRMISSKMDFNDPEAEGDYFKLPSRRSEARNKSNFDLNSIKQNKSTTIPFDEIKIRARDKYPIQQEVERDNAGLNRIKALPPRYVPNRSFRKEGGLENENILSPRELPSLKKLEKLTPEQFDESNKYFPIFNEVTFEYILSRDHGYRQKGLKIVNDILQKAEFQSLRETQQFVAACIYIVRKLIDDNLLSLLIGVVDFLGMMMKKCRPKAQGQLSKHVRYILDKLADYLGHNNDKFRQQVQDVFAALPAHELTNRQLCFEVLMGTPRQKMPKITAGKLNMLAKIIEKYEVSAQVDDLIDFGKKYLEDKNSQVRVAAVNMISKLSKVMGYQNLYEDLKGLKPQVIKMIQEKLQAEGVEITKIEINKGKSFKNIGQRNEAINNQSRELAKVNNPEYICDYCKIFDKRFENDDFRDQHLYSACKMITLCPECSQAIEVSTLNNHLLAQCVNHKYFKRCPKCKQAVPTREFNAHTRMKECMTAKAPALANRCPLCHEDIQAGTNGWVKHLVHQGCPLNSRH